jgi:multisubunit Na+/H+ antiporter MnhB subunit
MPFRPEMLLLFQIINKKAPVRQEVKKQQGLGQGHDGPALLQFVWFLNFLLYVTLSVIMLLIPLAVFQLYFESFAAEVFLPP